MVPVIELRGAIPWGEAIGLDLWISAVVSAFGNMLPVPFIILFIRKIFEWMRLKNEWLGNLVARFEAKAEKHKEKVKKYEFWGLFLFVAIPLPGTGAWTGALVAAMLEMRLKDAVPSIFLGVVIATILVSMFTAGLFSVFSSIFG
ncbi:MAG: small multi-drug export protein [Clostridia bacterium]|nr:small multi-drug export protein [Clostridia bacterium]MBQ9737778.1 small multi-drug export protein [Clostridia bacterium]